jgi:hypothetical protein
MGNRTLHGLYYLPVEEQLIDPELHRSTRGVPLSSMFGNLEQPRLGRGSGRAGGARSAAHQKHHVWRVGTGIKVEECPICLYGLEVWNLWLEGTRREAWHRYWECDKEERERCELVFMYYKSRLEWL